jgi:uncharacterized protein
MRYSLHITNNCNLRCTYCYEDDKQNIRRKQFVISFAEIDEKLKKIKSYGNCHRLELLGGEVLLYPDRLKYILENYYKNLNISITTNGMVRSKEIDGLINKYKPEINVSLDDPQTTVRQRIGIDFDRVLENAKYWRTITWVGICAVINPLNIRRIKETADFYLIEHGFPCLHLGLVEECMNDYYWDLYKKEAARLITSLPTSILQQAIISPWKYYKANKKEFIYEDGIEKVEIFNNKKLALSQYQKTKYELYCLYCKRLGNIPEPMIPDGVEVVEEYGRTVVNGLPITNFNNY